MYTSKWKDTNNIKKENETLIYYIIIQEMFWSPESR